MPIEYEELEADDICRDLVSTIPNLNHLNDVRIKFLSVIKTDANDEPVRWRNTFRVKKLPRDMAFCVGADVIVYVDRYSWIDVDCGVSGIEEHRRYIICSALCCILNDDRGLLVDYIDNRSVEILSINFPDKTKPYADSVYSKVKNSPYLKNYLLNLLTDS